MGRVKGSFIAKFAVAAVFMAVGFLQAENTARIPVVVNVDATVSIIPPAGAAGAVGVTDRAMSAGVQEVLEITLASTALALHGARGKMSAPASVSYGRGGVSLALSSQTFGDAQVSLFSMNGRRVLRGNVSAAKDNGLDISRPNMAKGIYLLSVKGAGGSTFTARVPHSGGRLGISVSFGETPRSLGKDAMSAADGWTITASADGYDDVSMPIFPVEGDNPLQTVTLNTAGANDAALVGEWKLVEESWFNNDGEITSYTSYRDIEHLFFVFSYPNKVNLTGFQKVDDFWIELSEDPPQTWRTSNNVFYFETDDRDVTASYTYSISGSTLTLTSFGRVNDIIDKIILIFTKSNITSLKNTLGTVHTQDSRLKDTYWRLWDGEYKYGRLEFGSADFNYNSYDDSRYFEESGSTYGNCYTSGSNLFLIRREWECLDANCDDEIRAVKETVQFTYTLGTSNDGKRTLRLVNAEMGIDDLWTEYVYDDDYYNGPSNLSKSKQFKRIGVNSSNPVIFKPFWMNRALFAK
jgi:hypothetical protein